MKGFDPVEIPLSGINLVEASAGTGKTYAIASLYVRLLIETRLETKDILVVTFTNAATDELKNRIRQRIKDALDVFLSGNTDDPFLKRLYQSIEDKQTARKLLLNAIRCFDEAAIFTIHGFCLRILRDHAFESCSLFDTDFIEDNSKFLQEIVNDFWRNHAYSASPIFLNYMSSKIDLSGFYDIVKKGTGNPFLAINADKTEISSNGEEDVENRCVEVYNEASNIWETEREYVISCISSDTSLNRQTYSKKTVETLFSNLETYFSSGFPLPLPEKFDYMCFNPPVSNAFKTTSKPTIQNHHFFIKCGQLKDIAEQLAEIFNNKIIGLKMALFEYARRESYRKKQEQNVRSFDDLLIDLHNALKGTRGKGLTGLINNRYKAALIDEFQDTDPLQYEIFTSIYNSKDCILFIIGDPKQSIYSFRGADIFAYIRAVKDIDKLWTLKENYRASERLISAVNAIFENANHPFVFDALSFVPVKPGNPKKREVLRINGNIDMSPLKLWLIERRSDGKPVYANDAREMLYKATAGEIVRLLTMGDSGEAVIDNKNVSASDIAILVRTNREARGMKMALNSVNVPCVIYSTENIFTTHEAYEISYILAAIAEPSNESRVKAALVTDMFGITGNQLAQITENEIIWNDYLERFVSYRILWLNSGFMNMARTLIAQEKIKARLLAMPDGERRLTNVLHCLELLHNYSVKYKSSPEGTIKWLQRKMELDYASDAEEYQIRLETDEAAVKIITIHRSKGLEYPIIFCPFCWGSSEMNNNQTIIYHNEKNNLCPTMDMSLTTDESIKRFYELEQLAENVRLLYVSLTRAKHRCYLACGSINRSETSAVAYILHPPPITSEDFSVETLKSHINKLTDLEKRTQIEKLINRSDGSIEILPIPEPEENSYKPIKQQDFYPVPRLFNGIIEKNWHISSFSSITSGKEQNAELPDRDKSITESTPIFTKSSVDSLDIFNFPRGTNAGSCLHNIFEHIDFSLANTDIIKQEIAERLGRFGIQSIWTDTIFRTIRNVLNVSIETGKKTLKLSMLNPTDKIHELEFYLPLQLINPKTMGQVFGSSKENKQYSRYADIIKGLEFNPVKGMLRGFIDMVFEFDGMFYIIDWKSNFLGPSIEDYNQVALRNTMEQEFYFLQYHLYTVAINSFLSFRNKGYTYDKHFGGVFYMFLRGIDVQKGQEYGIFFDRPSEGLVTEFNRYLKGI